MGTASKVLTTLYLAIRGRANKGYCKQGQKRLQMWSMLQLRQTDKLFSGFELVHSFALKNNDIHFLFMFIYIHIYKNPNTYLFKITFIMMMVTISSTKMITIFPLRCFHKNLLKSIAARGPKILLIQLQTLHTLIMAIVPTR